MSILILQPQSLPLDRYAGEPPLHSERMGISWLRQRFQNPAVWLPEFQSGRPDTEPPVVAAVLIALIARPGGLTVLLTRRHASLRKHPGQISFPGGRRYPADQNASATALREAHEEVGLEPAAVDVLGDLPPYRTGTGFIVTPVIGMVDEPSILSAQPDEVTDIFEVPLAFMMDGNHHQLRTATLPSGEVRTIFCIEYGPYFIRGATAVMIRNLFHFLRA